MVNPSDKPGYLNKSTCDSQNHKGLEKCNGKKPEHTKTMNNVINNNEQPQTDRSNNGAKANKDTEIIVKNPILIDQIMALK